MCLIRVEIYSHNVFYIWYNIEFLRTNLKAIITSTIFLLFSFFGNGQSDTSIAGVWKVISVYTDGIYYNFKTDSISLSKENKIKYADKSEEQKLITSLKMVFSAARYHFERNGKFKQTMDNEFMFDGTYRYTPSQKIIEITTKNSLNENVTEKVKCIVENGLLRLSMEWDDEMFDFVLDKE